MKIARLVRTTGGRIALSVAFWTAIGLIFAVANMLHGGGWRALLATQSNWWLWGLLSPAVLMFDRRLAVPPYQFIRRLVYLVGFGFFLTPFYVVLASAVEYHLGLNDWEPFSYPLWLFDWYLWSWLVYLTMVVTLQAYRYYVRYLSRGMKMEQLKRHYLQARMNALRMQLDPHFLFNALNTVSSQVERDPALAREMIGYLGDLLRLSLMNQNRQAVTLDEELGFLEPYMRLQKIRFGERLHVEMQIDPMARKALVPSLLLQPLAENAIRHGLSPRADGGTLSIAAKVEGGRLSMVVADDGVGLPLGWRLEGQTGIGLSATRRRLIGLYPDGTGTFCIGPREGGGTAVRIAIPFSDGEVGVMGGSSA